MTAYAFDEHRSEVLLRVESTSLGALFEDAARALCELTAGDVHASQDRVQARVVLRAIDLDALFADWLNELIYLSETRKEVFPEVRVERITDRELVALVSGVEPELIRTPVKAATMHDLHVRLEGGCWKAAIVLDV